MKLVLILPKSRDIVNLRAELISLIISKGFEVVTIAPENEYKNESEELGVKFITVNMNKNSTNILHDLKYLANISRIIRKEKPSIVLNYTIKPNIYGSIASKINNVNKIYSIVTGLGYIYTTNDKKTKILRQIINSLYKVAFSWNNKVFFQNNDDLDEFIKNKILKANKCVLVNGSGVNMTRFSITELPKNVSFLMIARILKNKGILEYFQAARSVKDKYPEVTFNLVGALEKSQDALTYADIKPYIDDGSIKYHGETKDVRPYISAATVYVLPSYREGTPRTVLEAMSMGRPIITTDAPGCRETVVDGLNGFLVPVKDSIALAEMMGWFITNKAAILKMGKASHQLCRDKFDVCKVNKVILRHLGT